ncbi:MAG: transporter substrate-binding protein [Hyphomicrobiales bacterium]|nr:transporter substrate-binding protein [Hyphomicrobiales bacterium]
MAADDLPVPSFWDPQRRLEKPDTSALRLIRFITEDDYPPFNFALPDGSLTGFNVEIARALCEELKVACTIQPRRWDTLVPAVAEARADAVIASMAITPENRNQLDFTSPYYKTPARFVGLRGTGQSTPLPEAIPETLTGENIGVQANGAHEAFLHAYFPGAAIRTYPTQAALRLALKSRDVKLIFGDGVSLALWLNGTDAADCCVFAGGPYTESRYFGDGIGIGVRKGNVDLRRALDYALKRLYERGVYADLYLKYFPVGFF